jgi:hypothetical protein
LEKQIIRRKIKERRLGAWRNDKADDNNTPSLLNFVSEVLFAGLDFMFNLRSMGSNVWLDSKTLQLAPYYYINGVGGWNYTEYDGVIVITLP